MNKKEWKQAYREMRITAREELAKRPDATSVNFPYWGDIYCSPPYQRYITIERQT